MVPFPAVPEVDEGTTDPITIAREISTPPLPPSDGEGGGAPQVGVGVEGREIVGDLEFVTLSGERASEIQRWMRRHDFAFHDTQESVVQSYLDDGWFIVAARVRPGAPSEGAMTPVRFEFDSEEPVYPLRVAGSSHATAIPMELYVVTPYRPASETYQEEQVEPIDGVFAEPED